MRVQGLGRIGAGLAAAIGLAGCSAGYIYATYGPPLGPTLVTVGCHTTYEVYENAKERLIMVRTNVGTQIASVVCRDPGVTPTPRRAVEYHFEATNRPKCTARRGAEAVADPLGIRLQLPGVRLGPAPQPPASGSKK